MFDDSTIDDPLANYSKGTNGSGFYPLSTLDTLMRSEVLLTNHRGSLPFRITIARTQDQLDKAVALRATTFGRKSLELATVLGKPDEFDYADGTVVLIAECKATGDCLGTMRIASNLVETLSQERHPNFPADLSGRRIARAERLGVRPGKNATLAKLTLFKALHRYCLAVQIDWIIVLATPPRDRDYRLLGFSKIMADSVFESRLNPGMYQSVLALNAHAAERQFHSVGHHLYSFMIGTWHPDIEIFSSVQSQWSRPRVRSPEAQAAAPSFPT